ncbi:MAG: knotted carbamoyltransferase YgeW [Tenuifilaceae bacterium]|jgi:knotted carbamoyltransferase YgeW|nr:knotted carbamoyltransferase YgeW [Tenuifilaceae bacterium]
MEHIKAIIDQVRNTGANLYGKDFLLTWEKSREELDLVLLVAEALKAMRAQNISTRVFDSGLAVSIFRDNSTRTRFSYASAANLLGLAVQDMDETKSQIAHGETVRETANMISFLTEIIGIRDDMYLGAGHTYMKEVGEALDDGYNQKVLPVRPGIVNLQCDVDHPTQSMADLMHLINHYGSVDALRGNKIAMTWAYSPSYGKPLSVPQGIINLMTRFGMEVTLAHPEGYNLIPEVVEVAKKNAAASGGKFTQVSSMEEAFTGADIVYPKSWAPFHVMGRRTELLRAQDSAGLKDLEKECLANNAKFMNWECDRAKMNLTKDKKALYMHCLPADITDVSCKHGEVSAEVFEQYRIPTYVEAGFKPYIIAAMMFTNRFNNPAEVLANLLSKSQNRVIL